MNRRKFLSTLSSTAAVAVPVAAVTATWPDFLRSAFAVKPAPPHAEDGDGLTVVSESFRRAQRAGKPLLVLIIPQGDNKWERGRHFGAWLNHGTADQLWPLALVEVACATMNDLRRLVPTVGLGEPLMVLVETDAVPTTVTRLNANLDQPAQRAQRPANVEEWRELERREDAQVDHEISVLARLVRKPLVDADALARRAGQARSALPPELLAQLQNGTPTPELLAQPAQVDRVAAMWAGAAVQAGAAPSPMTTVLAAAARERLLHQRVPGSHWANSSGCGSSIEGHPDYGRGIACGMGHVPAKSSRFLYFYTVPKANQPPDSTIL